MKVRELTLIFSIFAKDGVMLASLLDGTDEVILGQIRKVLSCKEGGMLW